MTFATDFVDQRPRAMVVSLMVADADIGVLRYERAREVHTNGMAY